MMTMRPARMSARISSTLEKVVPEEVGTMEPASAEPPEAPLAGPRGGREYTLDIGKGHTGRAAGGAKGVQDTGKGLRNEKRRPKAAFQVRDGVRPARKPRYPFDGSVMRRKTVWRIPRPPAMGDLRKAA
jgi:hypothetical protein